MNKETRHVPFIVFMPALINNGFMCGSVMRQLNKQTMESKASIWYLVSGLLAALGATACCVLPLILLLVGVTGAWIGSITALDAYRPGFYVLVVFCFWQAGRRVFSQQRACDDGTICAGPNRARYYRLVYVVVTLLAITLLASPWWLLLLIE